MPLDGRPRSSVSDVRGPLLPRLEVGGLVRGWEGQKEIEWINIWVFVC